jgi:hypothetical protein
VCCENFFIHISPRDFQNPAATFLSSDSTVAHFQLYERARLINSHSFHLIYFYCFSLARSLSLSLFGLEQNTRWLLLIHRGNSLVLLLPLCVGVFCIVDGLHLNQLGSDGSEQKSEREK